MGIHQKYMQEAVKEAIKALDKDEVPVGAVCVYEGRIIARGHNQMRTLKDPTAHAEMIAITAAAEHLKQVRLNGVTIYVTIEPCSMCTGALVLARVDEIVYGADDPKTGACGSVVDLASHPVLNHQIKVTKGIMKEDAVQLLQEFFKSKRTA